MTAAEVRDCGAMWIAEACGNGATITSEKLWISPGRDSLTLMIYSTRAGTLTLQASLSATAQDKAVQAVAIVASTMTRIVFADGPVVGCAASKFTSYPYLRVTFLEGGAGAAVVDLWATAGGPAT